MIISPSQRRLPRYRRRRPALALDLLLVTPPPLSLGESHFRASPEIMSTAMGAKLTRAVANPDRLLLTADGRGVTTAELGSGTNAGTLTS